MSIARAPRPPPTQAKLVKLLAALDELGKLTAPTGAEMEAYSTAHSEVQKIWRLGLPRGIDPAVVSAAIAAVMPLGYELGRITRKTGTDYDAAIIRGVRAHIERSGLVWLLEPALVAALSEHAGVSLAEANERLLRAERAVGRDPTTNLPAVRDEATLERVCEAMAPWFSPGVVQATLAIARDGVPPTRSANGKSATAPQCDEEWALFIACALHPSEDARAVIAARTPLLPLLDEAGRAAVEDVLAAGESRGRRA